MTVVGGSYFEICIDPHWDELYGSGLRAAASLSDQIPEIEFFSCIGVNDVENANAMCAAFNIKPHFTSIPESVFFKYYHPLSKPVTNYDEISWPPVEMPEVSADIILMYGMVEANCKVQGNYIVYDPQNWKPFQSTKSSAEHLAIVLNRKEAILLSGLSDELQIEAIGKYLLVQEKADVVVIKDGINGAIVIEPAKITEVPIYKTDSVWPIGSGDIFSATFAWKWASQKQSAADAANYASKFTAQYCQNKSLPLPKEPANFQPIQKATKQKNVYLAGPFFNLAERWLINEFRDKLFEFGNHVFSPIHDVGIGNSNEIAQKDLEGIRNADIMLAILSGMDPGTVFEVGYAIAIGKPVIAYAENVNANDLTMFQGSGIEFTDDFSTAVYKTS